MTRRELLSRLAQTMALVVVGGVGGPVLLSALSPALDVRRGPLWRPVGRIEDFPVGRVHKAVVPLPHAAAWMAGPAEQAVYVWRRAPEEVVVYSRSCTDLGCPLNWDEGSHVFLCPCHGGIFSQEGERMAGPPKRPMDRYLARLRDGLVEIDLHSVPPLA